MTDTLPGTHDILNCLANLSNDEVFTPPELANKMIDLLPVELFDRIDTTFLDPCCKSGVFLREIAKRLIASSKHKTAFEKENTKRFKGLSEAEKHQKRLDHIYHKQLFGIAITQLTALMSRRTLYCSKYPNTDYSISKFDDMAGNIRFVPIDHTWDKNGKCKYCGASQSNYSQEARGENRETHAYEFIHTEKPEELWNNMHFDVIIGNPPYQMSDAGAFASASPIYHRFVQTVMKLDPNYITMIIPARWYAGGKGLDKFRERMLKNNHIKIIHDYPIGEDCFPGIRIAGGVCYYLYDKSYNGDCTVYSHKGNDLVGKPMKRPLLEKGAETFIRINEAIPILRKVQAKNEASFSSIISARKPFGLPSDFIANPSKYNLPPIKEKKTKHDDIRIIGTLNYKTVARFADKNYPFPNGDKWIGKFKVFVSQVLDNGFDWTKERLNPFLGEKEDVCTETFLCVGCYESKEISENIISYMNTKLFHLLMFLKKVSHHVVAKVYEFVPMQDFSKPWTDAELYEKYGLTQDEIDFIESMIKAME